MVKPVISEKTINLAKEKNQYTFMVNACLTKNQIRKIIEKIFNVEVVKIATLQVKATEKFNWRMRKKVKELGFKKAIVTLPEKQKIDLFEGEGEK